MTAHEAGRYFSDIAAGYYVTDAGLLLLGILPIEAYVEHMDKFSASPKARSQMALAGIEANLLMACLLLILDMCKAPLAATFVMAASTNVALVLLNALTVKGLDGGMTLSDVCTGCEGKFPDLRRVSCFLHPSGGPCMQGGGPGCYVWRSSLACCWQASC